MTNPTCRSCPYWQGPADNAVMDLANLPPGECHHGPAHVQIVIMPDKQKRPFLQNHSAWPPKKSTDWCGRHPGFVLADRRDSMQ